MLGAVPILPGEEATAKTFYQTMRHNHHDALLDVMKQAGNATYYGAWLQTQPIGPWLIEYWSGDLNYQELTHFFDQLRSPFRQWYLDEKAKFCGDGLAQITGIRKIINCDITDVLSHGELFGNVLPIQPNRLGETVAYIDSVDRAQPAERTAYFKKMGLAYWQAWIEEYNDQHFLVQMHDMAGDFEHFRQQYQQEDTPFAKMIAEGWLDFFDMDLTKPEQWQKVERLLAVERNGKN